MHISCEFLSSHRSDRRMPYSWMWYHAVRWKSTSVLKKKNLLPTSLGIEQDQKGSSWLFQNFGKFLPDMWCHIPEDSIL